MRVKLILINIFSALRRSLASIYRERELIVRTDGLVRYVRLTRTVQVMASAIAIAVFGWVLGMTALWDLQRGVTAEKDEQLRESEVAFGDLLEDILIYRGEIEDATEKLQRKQAYALKNIGDKRSAGSQLPHISKNKKQTSKIPPDNDNKLRKLFHISVTQIGAELKQLAEMTDRLDNSLLRVRARMARGESGRENYAWRDGPVPDQVLALREQLLKTRARAAQLYLINNDLDKNLERARENHEYMAQERRVLEWRKEELEKKLSTAEGNIVGLKREFSVLIKTLEQSTGGNIGGSVEIFPETSLKKRAKTLLDQLANLHNSQENILERLKERTSAIVRDAERIIEMSGLDLSAVLKVAGVPPDGKGGPEISANQDGVGTLIPALASTIHDVEGHIFRWEALGSVLKSLPLISPVDHYHLTSLFGKRRDPFTKRRSMHYGLDLAGWNRAPVFSTAEGVVRFSGRKGRFGRMVEVDHGNGLRTRYGHLHKIFVRKGQKIGHRHKIGLLGSTGRSTGPHVHYEVLFNGQQVDPLKFIKAGRNVFKDPKGGEQFKPKRGKKTK